MLLYWRKCYWLEKGNSMDTWRRRTHNTWRWRTTLIESERCYWMTASLYRKYNTFSDRESEQHRTMTFAELLNRPLLLTMLWRRANARNVRLYYPYRQYTNLFIFRFVSEHCLRSTLRLFHYFNLDFSFILPQVKQIPWFQLLLVKLPARWSNHFPHQITNLKHTQAFRTVQVRRLVISS